MGDGERQLSERPGLLTWTADRLFWALLAVGIVLDGSIWLVIWRRIPYLQAVLPIHYASNGVVDRVGNRNQLYIFPIIGLVVIVINLALSSFIHKRDRKVCLGMLCVAIAVQLLLWGAVFPVVR